MSPSGRFLLAVVYGWSSLIGIARSFDTDPSAFFMDDLSFSPTDFSNPGDLSSDLFSAFDPDPLFDQDQGNFDFNLGPADTISTDPISADFDSQLWNWGDDSDLSAAFDEASCVGADGQPIEKMRLRRETGKSCPSPSSAGSTPQLPTFQQIEETVEGGAQNKPGAKVGDGTADDDSECPAPYRRHVCCTGPGLQTFRQSGIYDAVQGCEPCTYPMKLGQETKLANPAISHQGLEHASKELMISAARQWVIYR